MHEVNKAASVETKACALPQSRVATLKRSSIAAHEHRNAQTQQRTSAATQKRCNAATRPDQRGAVTTFTVGRSVVGIFAVIAFPERRFHMLLNHPS
jgi:hypothetical protein